MSNRNEILANFQAATGIEDCGDAFTFLESTDWNLEEAISKALPDTQINSDISVVNHISHEFSLPIVSNVNISDQNEANSDMDSTVESITMPLLSESLDSAFSEIESINLPSSSKAISPGTNVLKIYVQIISNDGVQGGSFPLEFPPSTTISEFKTILHQLIGIAPCYQRLEGFTKPMSGLSVISRDTLPNNNTITVITSCTTTSAFTPHLRQNGQDFNLFVHDEKHLRDHNLTYSPTKLVNDIKKDVSHLTGIPVSYQVWTGWPGVVGNNTTLSTVGICARQHHLTVNEQKLPMQRTPKFQRKKKGAVSSNEVTESGSTSSNDEYEDALLPDDDFLAMCEMPSTSSNASTPLIPANTDDEILGVLTFIENFQKRYGDLRPLFFHGTLEQALKESVMLPAKTRKPLALYLHHDKSVSCNVFCSQSLCHESIVQFLTNNFVILGWDLTSECNKALFLNSVSSHLGTLASVTIRSYGLESLPALVIVNRSRGGIEIISVIHGNEILDEVMTSLIHALDIFEKQRNMEVIEESEREVRETMMAEQDAAYHASLEADRAKALAKRELEKEQKTKRERQQSLRDQEDAIKEAVRASLESSLPDEPGPDCTEPTSTFRFRTPDNQQFIRVFTLSTPLQIVFNFLCVKGFSQDEYKFILAWPRRCLTTLDANVHLEQLKIHAQETVTIEERSHDLSE